MNRYVSSTTYNDPVYKEYKGNTLEGDNKSRNLFYMKSDNAVVSTL